MENSDDMASQGWRPPYWQYALLAVLFVLAVGFRVLSTIDYTSGFEGQQRRQMVVFLEPGTRIVAIPGRILGNAGVRRGDEIISVNGRPLRNLFDLSNLPEEVGIELKRANETVRVKANLPHRVPPSRDPRVPIAAFILQVLIPITCLGMGFWGAAVRPRDPQAWLLLLLMLTFPHLSRDEQWHWPVEFGRAGSIYNNLMHSLLPVALILFGIYFIERLRFDVRFPWVKWILLGPLLAGVLVRVPATAVLGWDLTMFPALLQVDLQFRMQAMLISVASIGLFFICIGIKTGTASTPDARRRLKLLLYGTQLALAPTFLLLIYSFVTGARFPWAFPLPLLGLSLCMFLLFPLTITYVVVVHRAMDVSVAVRQSIQYALVRHGTLFLGIVLAASILLAAVYYAIESDLSRPKQIQVIAAGVLAVVLLRRLRLRLAQWIDRRFFRDAYDAERVLSELSEKVRTIVDGESLVHTVGQKIAETLHVARLAFLLPEGDGFKPAFAVGYDAPVQAQLLERSGVVDFLRKSGEPANVYFEDKDSWVWRTESITERDRNALTQMDSRLLLPLTVKDRLLGVVSLGQKKSEEPYTGSDLRLLRSLAAQTGMALDNSRLTAEVAAEAAKRERLNREIEIAREVQERLFPQELPKIEGFDIAGYCRPALGVGGDYFDFLLLPENHLGIVIGDVAGKGIAAALLMASLQASVRSQSARGDANLAEAMERVNSLIYESSASSRYATLFYAQLDPAARRLVYVNAGHNPPILLRKDGTMETLEAGGMVVGLMPRGAYQQGTVELGPGDLLLGFTDGISEAMNRDNEEWGEQRMMEAVKAAGNCTAAELIPKLLTAADAFVNGAPQHDDMTAIVIRVACEKNGGQTALSPFVSSPQT
jgi:sigma-B regulation protein RsbU (phosphoserine phosphatase)